MVAQGRAVLHQGPFAREAPGERVRRKDASENAQQQCAAVQKERDEAWDRVAEVEAENEKLHLMLRESKGKELALHDVINWHLTRRQR